MATGSDDRQIKLLLIKAKKLRSAVRSGAANRRLLPMDPSPGVNNYASLTAAVLRAKKTTLIPLQAGLVPASDQRRCLSTLARVSTQAAMVATAATRALPDEMQKQLQLQPILMKGHLSELDYYLSRFKFEEARRLPTPPRRARAG